MSSFIHETAIVAPTARLAEGVHVGPISTVGEEVVLGTGVRLDSHVVIAGKTTIGAQTHVFPFASIGLEPQDLKYTGEPTATEIGERNQIHIINLEKTLPLFNDAMNFIGSLAAKKGKILFVGTKRAARERVRAEAERSGMPYVNHRWLGGMLTNFRTVKASI